MRHPRRQGHAGFASVASPGSRAVPEEHARYPVFGGPLRRRCPKAARRSLAGCSGEIRIRLPLAQLAYPFFARRVRPWCRLATFAASSIGIVPGPFPPGSCACAPAPDCGRIELLRLSKTLQRLRRLAFATTGALASPSRPACGFPKAPAPRSIRVSSWFCFGFPLPNRLLTIRMVSSIPSRAKRETARRAC